MRTSIAQEIMESGVSKQFYVDATDNASELALNYVLKDNSTANAAAIRATIAATPQGSYKEMGITLSRHYQTQQAKGDAAGAEATKDTMAYFAMREKIEKAQNGNHVVDDPGIASVKGVAWGGNQWNRINDDQRIATAKKAHDAELETQRVANLNPRDRALEDVIGKDDTRMMGLVRGTLDRFKGKGRGIEETRINIQNDLTDKPLHFWEYDSRSEALKVLKHQAEIEKAPKAEAHAAAASTAAVAAPAAVAAAPKAPAEPAHGAATEAPATATAAPAAPAAAAAPSAPAAGAHRSWTPIEKQVQFDLETLGKTTGQHRGWKIENGVESMDGKNGRHTGESLSKFLKDNNLTELNDAAKAKLHELAENQRRAQAAAKTAGAPAVAAGAGAGQPAGTPSAPAAAVPAAAAPAVAASR